MSTLLMPAPKNTQMEKKERKLMNRSDVKQTQEYKKAYHAALDQSARDRQPVKFVVLGYTFVANARP